MQMVKKSLIVLFVLWFTILFFMPKRALYYKLEAVLLQNDIKINEKNIEEGLFSLTLHDSKVYVKGIQLATVEKIDFFTLFFYTNVEVEKLILDESLKNVAPTQIDEVEVTHAIWNPLNLSLDAQGSFGGIEGQVSLVDRHMRVDFNETKNIEMLKANLKQDEKGWFYETSF
ncbi:MAG TPA: hypothetical protein EYG82_04350 [Sulfurovum sp.]|nr:hypothetical protein [Sulfurovum sp.]